MNDPMMLSDSAYNFVVRLEKRIKILEHVFKRLAEFDMRLDNIEFHSDTTLSPAISEQFLDMKLRLAHLESLIKKEDTNV